jgi:hypothetical protein
MKRILTLWLALLAVFWAGRTALGLLLLGRVDQGYPAALQLVAVPAVQAAALGWITRRSGGVPLALPWQLAWSRRRLALVLSAELVVLAAGGLAALGWLAPLGLGPEARATRWLALGARGALPAWSAAAQLAAAAALFAWAAARGPRPLGRRIRLALLAAGLLAAAAWPLAGRFDALPRILAPAAAVPALLCAAAAAAAAFLLLAAIAALRPSSPAAARALEWTLGLAWLALAAYLLGPGLRPAAPQPLAALAGACGGLGASAALVGSYLSAFPATLAPAASAAGRKAARTSPALTRRDRPPDGRTIG